MYSILLLSCLYLCEWYNGLKETLWGVVFVGSGWILCLSSVIVCRWCFVIHKTWAGRFCIEELNGMIKFCLSEYYFIFKNQVVLAYLAGFTKTCPICGICVNQVSYLLIYTDTILTEGASREAAHSDFFVKRYNVDIWKSSHKQFKTPVALQENRSRESLKKIIFTHSSKLTSETVNIIHLRKIQVALKSRLIWKWAKTVFLKVKVDFKVDLNSRMFSKCVRTVLRNQGWFQLCMIWDKNFFVLLKKGRAVTLLLFLWGISWWWKVKTTFPSLIFWKTAQFMNF